ncbi:MAG: nucleotidyltransferase domain-containing protein [Candidatus Berkelbacteria bacterium]|nr:nucleotidyltransferase domain-containing protein [Candidatus Berkelbacteria bacterium]
MEGFFQKRLKKAKLVASLLQVVPFVRMIGLNGSMTKGTMNENSDIDFLIIAEHGRIWTARFFTIFLTVVIGQRESKAVSAGKICLNRYQSDQFLEIKPHNFYHAETFSPLAPLYNDNIYTNYQKANKWMEKFGFKVVPSVEVKLRNKAILKGVQKVAEVCLQGSFGNYLEKVLRSYQLRKIAKNKEMIEAPKGRVRISDWELCFHPGKDHI